ncbi:hypothetical protein KZW05_25760, partial [Klebsiella pneumoniae]|uniref:hypothetical protein n=1 Tax=Klebsiella pneumoniae TaxID=573 RepID=UPI001C5F262D
RKRAYCLKIQPATGSFARNLIYSTKPTGGEMYPGIILMERCIFGVLNMPVRMSSEGMTGNV